MKVGDRVLTPHGEGEIVHIEEIFKKNRYGVKLDKSPFFYEVAGYWRNEIELAREKAKP